MSTCSAHVGPLEDLRLAVLMLDGIELKGRCCVVALGIDSDGVKHPHGLWYRASSAATWTAPRCAGATSRRSRAPGCAACAS